MFKEMRKSVLLLLVATFIVTLFTVSCSKKKDDSEPETPKVFSMTTNFTLDMRKGVFAGTFENADGLTELNLMLKVSSETDYESYEISFNKSKFSKAINDLSFQTYNYYYEYVLDGVNKTTDVYTFGVLVGRWQTADGGHCEVYNADGTGHMWDPADDVQEDEADTFSWTIDEHNMMTQIVDFHSGASGIPQYCNILKLTATSFKYNNEGLRATYDLIRVN